jgi:ABC-type branched-subunit amino acid transport system substrate-binding protein
VAYYYDSVYAIGGAFKQIKENCTGLTQALGTDYCRTTNLTTTEFQRVVAYTMFDGATGLIDFESNNRQSTTIHLASVLSSSRLHRLDL